MTTKKTTTKKPDISPAAEESKTASPMEALGFLDGVLGKVAGSRADHVSIQGAIGIIASALDAK